MLDIFSKTMAKRLGYGPHLVLAGCRARAGSAPATSCSPEARPRPRPARRSRPGSHPGSPPCWGTGSSCSSPAGPVDIFFRYRDIYKYVSTTHLDHALVLHVAEWFVLLLVAWLGAVSGLGLVPAEGGRRHGHGRGPAGGTRAGPARAAPSSAILGLARRYYF